MKDYKSSSDTLNTTDNEGSRDGDTEENNNNCDKKKTVWSKKKIFCVISLTLANFTFGVNYAMIGPFFPQEAASKGMSPGVTGIVFSVFELVVICSSPFLGIHIVKLGERRTFITGLILTGFATISFGMLMYCPGGDTFIALCIIIRMVWGLGSASFFTASLCLIGNMFPDKLASMVAYMEVASSIGMMLGPPIGGFFYNLGGFKLPFIGAGSLCLVIAVCSLFVLESQKSSNNPSGRSFLWPLLKLPVVLLMILSIMSGMSAITFIDVGLALRLDEVYHFSPLIIGAIFLVGPGVYALSSLIWANIADSKPHLSVILTAAGSLISSIGYLLMGPAPFLPIPDDQLWLLLVSLAMVGIGCGTFVVSYQVMTIGARQNGMPESPEVNGAISGMTMAIFSLGAFTGPFAGGYLIETIQFQWSAFVFGCVMLLYSSVATVYIISVQPCKGTSHHEATNSNEPEESQPLVMMGLEK